jgi:uncharacterized protein (UPF0332 family)
MHRAYFDHGTYLALANELNMCSSADPLRVAKQRSAISRAYYAVFLHARQFHPDRDVRHQDLIRWVKDSDRQLGRAVEEIKSFREDCDYDRPIEYDLANKAQECIDLARELMSSITELFGS